MCVHRGFSQGWDGSSRNIDWYVGHETSGEYVLRTAEDLAGLSQLVSGGVDFSGKFIMIEEGFSIDMRNFPWMPIGTHSMPFRGKFDGNGATILGLNISEPESDTLGFFGCVYGKVKNLTIKGKVLGRRYIAGVCGYLGSTSVSSFAEVENCHFVGTVRTTEKNEEDAYVGGIVGEARNYAKINRCSTSGKILMSASTDHPKCVGGIVGRVKGRNISTSYLLVENCINLADVHAYSSVSGIVGYAESYVKVLNNLNVGNIRGKSHYVGGILGGVHQHDTIANNISVGSVDGQSSVIGYCNQIDDCYVRNNYYDMQRSLPGGIGHLSRNSYYSEDVEGVAEGVTTNKLISPDFIDSNFQEWAVSDGYPVPKQFSVADVVAVAKSYVLFNEEDKYFDIKNNFVVSNVEGVSWHSSDESVIEILPPEARLLSSGEDTLVVYKNDLYKNVLTNSELIIPLPIELIAFSASCNGNSILVEWTTATERNNDYFVLEKSYDALDFHEITRIDGAGNSIEKRRYSFADYEQGGRTVYYRLRQVDYDGTNDVSEIIDAVCHENMDNPEINIYPNPFHDELVLSLENFGKNSVTVEIFDIIGALVMSGDYAFDYEIRLNLSELAPANYTVRLSSADFVTSVRVVKQ